jgi:XTP/dITP diphosphohydrolase
MKKLVLASRNKHKVAELKALLKDINVELLTLNDFPDAPPLVEDGSTFEENALKKSRTVYHYTKLPALADDSGLEVFFLNGRPGVRSARYAGENANDERNNEKLLEEMKGVPPRRRRAQFRSVLAFVGEGYEEIGQGVCPGKLAEEPRGTNGFGYDPIFIPDGFTRTYAELTFEEKNKISHRSRALADLSERLRHRLA